MAETVKSTCCYCGVGCGILLHRDRKGRVTVTGDPDHPVNRGMLCSKGRNLHHTVVDQGDRLLRPQIRDHRDGPLRDVTWDEALDKVAAQFRRIIADHGPDAVAFYVSGQCLTEEYYLYNKLMKGFIGSNNIDTNSRLCMSSAVVGYKLALGEDSVPGCYDDLEEADCWLITGANPAFCHPILYRRLEARRARPDRGRMIVVDPRRTETAADADLHLALLPGTDVALYRGLARLLIEAGLEDEAFVRDHTEGWEAFRAEVLAHSAAQYAQACGVPLDDLALAARWIGESKGFVSLWAMGLNQSVVGVEKNLALINLHLLTGRIGTPGNGPFSLTGQPNAMGGREVGGLSTLLPAHRDLADPDHRAEVARFWGVDQLSGRPGLTATQMIDALADGRLKALWVVCTNPLVSLPDLHRVEAALGNAELVVVQEMSSRADTLGFADVVLPGATWAEKEGTMTNSERRMGHLAALVPPPGQALADAEIALRFAAKMGWGASFAYTSMAEVFAEHARLTQGTRIDISGLSYDRMAEGTYQWPVPTPDSPGTPRLFTDGQFARPGGRARLSTTGPLEVPASDPRYPLILTTGRLRDQWHTMTRTGKVAKLGVHEPEAFLEVHPRDAAARHLVEGQLCRVTSTQGQVVVRARVTDGIRPGVVFLPMHWGRVAGHPGARANNLTEARLDPRSKQPDLKYQAVEVEAHGVPPRRVVVVGAGAAAAAFVRALRSEGSRDEVTVLSREAQGFYNRVLLPHYLEGTHSWDDLQTLPPDERLVLGLDVREGVEALSVDRAAHTVTASDGRTYPYDLLVLATGSRAVLPPVVGGHLPGVFTLRRRADADALVAHLAEGPLVVVGGGVLALEVAGAFLGRGAVTLVHRSARLMERQLDPVASALLVEALEDRGLPLVLDDQVAEVEGPAVVTGVRLASGRRLDARAVVFATGTAPEVGLARAAGLTVDKGVVVDDRLVTSDPAIVALGEIAQWNGQVWGITPAAEDQAQVAARALMGDPFARYRGTTPVNLLKVDGLAVATAGRLAPLAPHVEQVVFHDPAQGTYQRVVVEHDRVVGVLLLGDKGPFPGLKALVDSGQELGDARAHLLRSGAPAPQGTGRVVCSCQSVRLSVLEAAVVAGATDVPGLMAATGAGTGCGSCRPELARLCAPGERGRTGSPGAPD